LCFKKGFKFTKKARATVVDKEDLQILHDCEKISPITLVVHPVKSQTNRKMSLHH